MYGPFTKKLQNGREGATKEMLDIVVKEKQGDSRESFNGHVVGNLKITSIAIVIVDSIWCRYINVSAIKVSFYLCSCSTTFQ